jgi:hypothetical protein
VPLGDRSRHETAGFIGITARLLTHDLISISNGTNKAKLSLSAAPSSTTSRLHRLSVKRRRNDRLLSGSAQSPAEGDPVMVNIQYFADKVKAGRDATAGPSSVENAICTSNGKAGTRPGASHSISKFANIVGSER